MTYSFNKHTHVHTHTHTHTHIHAHTHIHILYMYVHTLTHWCVQSPVFRSDSMAPIVPAIWKVAWRSTTILVGGAPSVTTCGALKMLTWHVVCSASSRPFRPPGELHLGRGLESSGSTTCSATEQRVPSSSVPIMDCLNITASIARMLECPAQVSSNCVCVALVTLFFLVINVFLVTWELSKHEGG